MRFNRPGAGWLPRRSPLKAPGALGAAALLLVLGLVPTGALDHRLVHFALSKSEPAAETTVAPPEELRLWFTQAPQEKSTSIRLLAGDEVVETGPAVPAPQDDRVYTVAVEQTLEAGSYTVTWRAMAGDGHVVRGEIPFMVQVP